MAVVPLVGLPTDRIQQGPHPFLAAGEKYIRAVVEAAGAMPVLLPSLQPTLEAGVWLDRLDGLLLTGAVSNVEPHHYSDEPSWEGNLHDPARDATSLGLIPQAIARGLPVLAICRGLQEVNVALGGRLHQRVHEVPGLADHREDRSAPLDRQYGPAHLVQLQPGGWLAGISEAAQVRVNSLHGQGIAKLADGLVVEATAPDGLIEAFRGAGPGFCSRCNGIRSGVSHSIRSTVPSFRPSARPVVNTPLNAVSEVACPSAHVRANPRPSSRRARCAAGSRSATSPRWSARCRTSPATHAERSFLPTSSRTTTAPVCRKVSSPPPSPATFRTIITS